MADKKFDYVVQHSKLYFAVDGRLKHVPAGTEISMTKKQAKRLRGKIVAKGTVPVVDVGGGVEDLEDK